ncbi:MAG: iron ABC transporter permease [Candidatus Hydrogenedentes bacterium]|nr:iron ABC transporter permease [Candidatus Hydrogenedentota bacterium]MBI3118179.1 iron ABC transporter permease [Candidatus Hydrogenedentota bacterium]
MRPRMLGAVLLLCASVAMGFASLVIGTENIELGTVVQEWRAGRPVADSPALSVLFNQRLPRTLAALLGGAGLALAGGVFQALLRNPLATPYTLGIASAGAFGAWIAFILSDAGWFVSGVLGIPSVQVFAFLFAGADVLLVYMLAARKEHSSPAVLLLAGVTMGMLANSGIMLTRYLAAPDRLVAMDRWLMGGVDVLGYRPVWTLTLGVAPCALVLLAQAGKLDQFGFSGELAAGRGVNIKWLQILTFSVGSLMTAIIVSVIGPVGFIGLIVPHAVRALTGPRHYLLLALSLVAGGGFLCFCDIIARKILPGETPIGIVTTLIGGPFFLYLLMRRKFTDWDA